MGFILKIDNSILDFIQHSMRNHLLDKIMPAITKLGNDGLVWIIITIILLILKKYRKYGVMMVISLLLMQIFCNLILKNAVGRVRPFQANGFLDLLINKPKDSSFPSGHTYCAFAAAGVLYYMNKRLGIFGIALACLIAFSRLYLYVHYPSDVLAGMVLGILTAIISINIYNKFIALQLARLKK